MAFQILPSLLVQNRHFNSKSVILSRMVLSYNIILWVIDRFLAEKRHFRVEIGLFRIKNRYFWIQNVIFQTKMMNLVIFLK